MLGRRLISAFVIISILLLLLVADFWLGSSAGWERPGIMIGLLSIALAMLAGSELISLWPDSQRPNQRLVICCASLMVTVACVPAFLPSLVDEDSFVFPFAGLILAFAITFGFEMWTYRSTDGSNGVATDRLGRATLIYCYLMMLFGFVVPHRVLGGSNGLGLISLVTLITTVKLSDSFAYFAGKSLGTVKLAPVLSPKKTIQGGIGALIGGYVGTAFVVYFIAPLIFGMTLTKPWWWVLAYGVLVTAAGMTGDLAESLLKRDADCKDSSHWLPGLGGLLDVLDSLVFAAPLSYFLWKFVG